MFSTANQAYVFLSTVYAGIIIGFIYDCYRIVRRITKPGKLLTGIMDLFFWLVVGVLSYLVIFYVNSGEVRIYTIAGFAIGWALYALTLSPIIMKILIAIYTAIAKAINWTIKIILLPFKKLQIILSIPIKWVKNALSRLFAHLKRLATITFKKRMKKEND